MAENEKNKDELPEEEAAPVEEPESDEAAPVEEETVEEVAAEAEDEVTAEAEADDEAEAEDVEEDEEPAEEPVKAEKEPKGPTGFDKVAEITKGFLKTGLPDFRPGDTVKVFVKIIEGSKERIQVFEGVVIAIKHGGIDKTFKVRKTSWGVGVERTFFLHSPKIDKIVVSRRGRVRRAKLYYLRERAGKSARIKERRMKQ